MINQLFVIHLDRSHMTTAYRSTSEKTDKINFFALITD